MENMNTNIILLGKMDCMKIVGIYLGDLTIRVKFGVIGIIGVIPTVVVVML
jgi:hypothetical protein